MKRGRAARDSLTGGTGDVNPQLITFTTITQDSANSLVTSSVNVPISRLPGRSGKAIIIEVLKVFFHSPSIGGQFSATGSNIFNIASLSTSRPLTQIDFDDPTIFAVAEREARGAFTGGGSYALVTENPVVYDLTDNAGHGFLVATDNIWFSGYSQGYSVGISFDCRMLYRFKEVALEEYIGIVQSQQRSTGN